ncbi:MAG: nicotinate (nicotinamide) nucleotide adenylyltransferase [Candidatus Sumerlaeaceae bacterium]|nr:nicotinate (nicotinamide) nucleotide adenylyltransferase [Candidatus Sumerlaeaceae bacterium]
MSGVPSEAYRIPRRIGFFGGSFNPPHIAHVLAVHYALLRWQFDFVAVVPTFHHPFDKELVDFAHRLRMTRIAFELLGDNVHVLSVEQELPHPSYTWQTMQHLRQCYPESELALLIGSDILEELPRWHNAESLQREFPIYVIPRIGQNIPPGAFGLLPALSSSQVRELLRKGEDVSGLVPARVLGYIREYELYTNSHE